jgi:5-(carboxyamino)imidazole ribonucleotide synthase
MSRAILPGSTIGVLGGGSSVPRPAAAMANLRGDLWESGEPDRAAALAIPEVRLHLYGESAARAGRKWAI